MSGTLAVPSQYSTEQPQLTTENEAGTNALVLFAERVLGGRRSEAEQGLSVVSYLTGPSLDAGKRDGGDYRVDLETGEVTTPSVTFYEGGSLVQATRNKALNWDRKPGKRGKVDPKFSKGARRRMMRMFATVKRPTRKEAPLFITLTYPGKEHLWQHFTPDDWKRHLDTWWKRARRFRPNASAVWRLEPQKRGAPHFHLVMWGLAGDIQTGKAGKRQWKALMEWVSHSWWEVIGSGDTDHLKAGTNCQRVKHWKHLMFYVSKYMAKVGEAWRFQSGSVGRLWGVLGRSNVPWATETVVEVSGKAAVRIIRLGRKYARLKGKRFDSLSWFCDASFWHSKLSGVLC